tara:strand:+ start:574 stop:852 length:279 start_codon:yes stop_codon:yes gene_type:complete
MINSKTLKKDIFAAYVAQEIEIERLNKEIEILQNSKKSQILTIDDYGTDFVNRCEIHGKEFNLFIEDLKLVVEFLKNKIKETRKVELPAFLK